MLLAIALIGIVASSYIRTMLLAILIALELLLLAAVMTYASYHMILNEASAQLMISIVLTLAGSETSIALALIVRYYRYHDIIALEP